MRGGRNPRPRSERIVGSTGLAAALAFPSHPTERFDGQDGFVKIAVHVSPCIFRLWPVSKQMLQVAVPL